MSAGINKRVVFYLPKLEVLLESDEVHLLRRLSPFFSRRFHSRDMEFLTSTALRVKCSCSKDRPTLPPESEARSLGSGYWYWSFEGQSPDSSSLPGGCVVVANAHAMARIEEDDFGIVMTLDLHPDHLVANQVHLEHFLEITFSVLFPIFGYFPLQASAARSGPRRTPRQRERVLILGPRDARTSVLATLSTNGWQVSDREPLYVIQVQGDTYLMGGSQELPAVYPDTVVFLDPSPEGARQGGTPSARSLLVQLMDASPIPEPVLLDICGREHTILLRNLLAAAETRRVCWQSGDPASAARSVLSFFGMKPLEIQKPRTYRCEGVQRVSGLKLG